MFNRGSYIVIEGIDGSGKTTQFNHLLTYFDGRAIGVREPGGTPMGEQIRAIIKNKEVPRNGHTNTFLFAAARADLVETVIRPTIAQGKHVVSDRNWLSTVAYQGAEGVSTQEIENLNQLATGEFFEPDLLLLVDTDLKLCRQRTQGRGGAEVDYFDSKGNDYFVRVRDEYLKAIRKRKNGVIIDGAGTSEEVWQRVLGVLNERGIT